MILITAFSWAFLLAAVFPDFGPGTLEVLTTLVIEVGPLLTVGSIAFTTARSFEDRSFGMAASGAGENVLVAYSG